MNDTTLTRIADALERIASALESNSPRSIGLVEGMEMLLKSTKAPDQPLNTPVFEPTEEPAPAPTEEPAPAPIAEPEQTKPNVTIDQIRKEVVALSSMGKDKKDAVREIIMAYAPNVSGIPADKYPEVMDKLTALKEG